MDAANYLKLYLEDCNFEVETFETVTQSISSIKFNQYSLILLDINLPDYDGFEILRFINKYHINIPVIITSAYSNREYKLQAFRLGASDYVCKPIDPEELELRIWVHLKNQTQLKQIEEKVFSIENNTIYFNQRVLQLTKIEFEILSYLIKNIREKIDDNGSNPKYLITEYGTGYKLIF
jgi:DNA-binding response OmpR family regulator